MAALSVAAYGKDNRSAQGSINYQNTSHDNVLSGWSAITFDIPQSGTYWDDRNFYNVSNAELMVAVNGNTLAVAFRGSQAEDFDENTETWGEPLRDDWYSARFGLTAYVENFEPFLQGLNAYLQENQNIDTLWLTGHSLGGATAETYAASFANDAAFFNIRSPLTVTFGSPGTNLITNSSITNLYHIDHTGDPVSNNILINHSFEGMQIEIDLPNTNGGLVNVWPPDVVAEHLSQLYSDNISEIVGSVLYENTSSSTVLRVAEQASDDTVAGLNTQEDELILGLSGDDTFWEGRRGVGSVDYIDGGDGTDVLDFQRDGILCRKTRPCFSISARRRANRSPEFCPVVPPRFSHLSRRSSDLLIAMSTTLILTYMTRIVCRTWSSAIRQGRTTGLGSSARNSSTTITCSSSQGPT